MDDLLAIIAIFISAVSFIFILIEKIPDITIKYKESEETINRKLSIKKELDTILKTSIKEFIIKYETFEEEDSSLFKKINELSEMIRLYNLPELIVEKYSQYSKGIIKSFLVAALFSIFPFLLFLYGSILFKTIFANIFIQYLISLLYSIPSIYLIYIGIIRYNYRNLLRESFIKLYENPRFDVCKEIDEELKKKEEAL